MAIATMKKSKFTNEQIAFALKQAENGTPVEEVSRKLGISQQTFFRWKKKFEGLGVAEMRRLKSLEEENMRLKSPVADSSLAKQLVPFPVDGLKKVEQRMREYGQEYAENVYGYVPHERAD